MLFKGAAVAAVSWLCPSPYRCGDRLLPVRVPRPPCLVLRPRPITEHAPTSGPAHPPRAGLPVRSRACRPGSRWGSSGKRWGNASEVALTVPGFHNESEGGQRANCGGSAQKSAVQLEAGRRPFVSSFRNRVPR